MTPLPKKLHRACAIFLGAAALTLVSALHAQTATPPAAIPAPDSAAFPLIDEDEGPMIIGEITGNQYISPIRAYRITIPIHPELGGEINDTQNVVTFQDMFGEHVSIGCFPMDEKLRAEETKRGRKEFLVWFFQTYIHADFARTIPGTTAEPNAKFINSTQGGTLFTQLLLPGGSVFEDRVFIFPPKTPPVAKRGNFVFINNGNIYVLSTELADRIFEHDTYKKTAAEEEEFLRHRLFDILNKIIFMKTPAPAATTGSSAAPAISQPQATPAQPAPSIAVPAVALPGADTNAPSGTKPQP